MYYTPKGEENWKGEFKTIHDDVPVLRLKQYARQDEFEVNLEKVREESQDDTSQINVLHENPLVEWIEVLSIIASKLKNMTKKRLKKVLYRLLIECEIAKDKIFENTFKCIKTANKDHQIEREKREMYLAQQTENPIVNWNKTKMESEMDLFDNKVLEWREATRKIQENIVKCIAAANKALEIEIIKPIVAKMYLTIKFDELAQQTLKMLAEETRKLEDLLKTFKLQLEFKEKKAQSRQLAAILNSQNASMEKEELEQISYQREIMEIEAEISEMKKVGNLLVKRIAEHKEKVDRLNEGKKLLTEILIKIPTKECHASSSQAAKNFHDMKDLESKKATPTPSGERKLSKKNRFKKQKLH